MNLAIIYETVLPVGAFVISPKNHVLIFVDALITRILTCRDIIGEVQEDDNKCDLYSTIKKKLK